MEHVCGVCMERLCNVIIKLIKLKYPYLIKVIIIHIEREDLRVEAK